MKLVAYWFEQMTDRSSCKLIIFDFFFHNGKRQVGRLGRPQILNGFSV